MPIHRSIIFSPISYSTQHIINTYFQNINNIVCVCDYQNDGLGRGGNKWVNPYGCLTFSYKVSINRSDLLPQIQYVISIAYLRALKSIDCCKDLDIAIKWPNDIFAKKSLKIAGILCQSQYNGEEFIVTCGIGLNISNSEPTTCLQDLIKEKYGEKDMPIITREEILSVYFREFDEIYEKYKIQGFRPLIPEYLDNWLHTNQIIHAKLDEQTIKMKIKGVTEYGYLIAKDDNNIEHVLYPDGNRFDFFNGLIIKK